MAAMSLNATGSRTSSLRSTLRAKSTSLRATSTKLRTLNPGVFPLSCQVCPNTPQTEYSA